MIITAQPMFEAYPLQGEETISVWRVPTPYQTYDGHGTLIGGTTDLTVINDVLRSEQAHPIQTTNDRAIMAVWIVDFTEKVVAYNRELLGLDAKITRSTIQLESGRKFFQFMDEARQRLLEGHVKVGKRTAPGVGWQLFRLLGLRQTLKALSQPYLGAKVVNPISDTVRFKGDTQSYVASDTPAIQWFDASTGAIQFGASLSPHIDFQPEIGEHFAPFRFVYLQPQKPT